MKRSDKGPSRARARSWFPSSRSREIPADADEDEKSAEVPGGGSDEDQPENFIESRRTGVSSKIRRHTDGDVDLNDAEAKETLQLSSYERPGPNFDRQQVDSPVSPEDVATTRQACLNRLPGGYLHNCSCIHTLDAEMIFCFTHDI